MDRYVLKSGARQALKTNWGAAICAMVIVVGFHLILSVVLAYILRTGPFSVTVNFSSIVKDIIPEGNPLAGNISTRFTSLLGSFFVGGYLCFYLNLSQGLPVRAGDVTSQANRFFSFFFAKLMMGIMIALWSLLFVIPGIIASFRYSQTLYLMARNPQLSSFDAIQMSGEMMRGHKMELFVLQLSFIGWHLVGIFTLGLGYLFVVPYIETTMAAYHQLLWERYTASHPI